MAYSVVSKAELKAAGLGPSRGGRGGYSVVSQAELKRMGDPNQTTKDRQKELRAQAKAAAKAKQQKQAARAAKSGGGGGGKQRRVPAGSPRGGEFTK